MTENKIVANNGSSIVLYTTDDGNTQLEVKLEKDTVWLNREQIAQLYGRDYKTIAKHINNALREELEGEPVVAKFATPKKYGRKEGYTQMQRILSAMATNELLPCFSFGLWRRMAYFMARTDINA